MKRLLIATLLCLGSANAIADTTTKTSDPCELLYEMGTIHNVNSEISALTNACVDYIIEGNKELTITANQFTKSMVRVNASLLVLRDTIRETTELVDAK
ncbi:hypothetical protein [Enterovibrio calviensis]|uniref:hypothetical protein n=1 Tax=Enterovibrio calviensis TaxID=91359 RepID=UPI00048537EE|nr:hypothetical protein [Enterovibrio calviensis]